MGCASAGDGKDLEQLAQDLLLLLGDLGCAASDAFARGHKLSVFFAKLQPLAGQRLATGRHAFFCGTAKEPSFTDLWLGARVGHFRGKRRNKYNSDRSLRTGLPVFRFRNRGKVQKLALIARADVDISWSKVDTITSGVASQKFFAVEGDFLF